MMLKISKSISIKNRQCLKIYNIKTTFKEPNENNNSNNKYKNNVNYLNNLFYNYKTSCLSGEELSILINTKFGNRCKVELVTKDKTTYLHFKDSSNNDSSNNYKMSYYNEIATLINSHGDPNHIRNMILHSDIKIMGKTLMELPILEVPDI